MAKPPATHESETFEAMFGESISTEEQAIDDGVLHHLWPAKWPWLLVTNTLFELKPTVLIPLVMDAIRATERQAKLNPRCDFVEIEQTAIGTVWVRPNSKGGMTIMKPEEN